MKCLERNKREIHYALCEGMTVTDRGEESPAYGEPVSLRIHVSNGTSTGGAIGPESHGKQADSIRVLISDKPLPFDRNTVFWIDRAPVSGEGEPVPHDFVLCAPPLRTPNGYSYRLRLVGDAYA